MNYQIMLVNELKQKMSVESNMTIIDNRDSQSFEEGHIEKALSYHDPQLSYRLAELSKSEPIICICYHGISSQKVAAALVDIGFTNVFSLEGGYEAWKVINH